MTISHHPSPERLVSYAAGQLDEGQRLLIAAHLQMCPACRAAVADLDHVGGALLCDLPPAEMRSDALEQALARLDRNEAPDPDTRPLNDMIELPDVLRRNELEPWRWAGPGVRWRGVKLDAASRNRVFLLKARPGTQLPQHTHSGSEFTLVLKGAFAHEGGHFGVGDFEDADGDVEHRPMVDAGEECICLVAMDGHLQLSGLVGRLIQPLIRF